MELTGVKHRIVGEKEFNCSEIDFDNVNSVLSEEREKSLAFLNMNCK